MSPWPVNTAARQCFPHRELPTRGPLRPSGAASGRGEVMRAERPGQSLNDGVQAVVRALAILDELANYPAGGTPKALAAQLGLSSGTVYRLLKTLVAQGYVIRDPDSRLFLLGARIPRLNAALLHSLAVPERLRQFAAALHRATGETTHLLQWWGQEVMCSLLLDGIRQGHVTAGYVGVVGPAHLMAAGQVLLAWADPERVAAYLARQHVGSFDFIPEYCEQVDFAAVGAQLAAVRAAGYAVDPGNERFDTSCIAAPIFGAAGRVDHALGVIMPRSRLATEETVLVETVRGIAGAASSALQADGFTVECPPGRRVGVESLLLPRCPARQRPPSGASRTIAETPAGLYADTAPVSPAGRQS